jgi:hypothetical protein
MEILGDVCLRVSSLAPGHLTSPVGPFWSLGYCYCYARTCLNTGCVGIERREAAPGAVGLSYDSYGPNENCLFTCMPSRIGLCVFLALQMLHCIGLLASVSPPSVVPLQGTADMARLPRQRQRGLDWAGVFGGRPVSGRATILCMKWSG